MAKTFEYKRTTVSKLKAIGVIDTDKMTIDIDGEEKSIKDLLADFNGTDITLAVQVKSEEDLEDGSDE